MSMHILIYIDIISLADCRESNKTFHRNLFQYHYFLLRHERKIKVFLLPSLPSPLQPPSSFSPQPLVRHYAQSIPYRSTRTFSLFYYKCYMYKYIQLVQLYECNIFTIAADAYLRKYSTRKQHPIASVFINLEA